MIIIKNENGGKTDESEHKHEIVQVSESESIKVINRWEEVKEVKEEEEKEQQEVEQQCFWNLFLLPLLLLLHCLSSCTSTSLVDHSLLHIQRIRSFRAPLLEYYQKQERALLITSMIKIIMTIIVMIIIYAITWEKLNLCLYFHYNEEELLILIVIIITVIVVDLSPS